jgi:hypothetical protein
LSTEPDDLDEVDDDTPDDLSWQGRIEFWMDRLPVVDDVTAQGRQDAPDGR